MTLKAVMIKRAADAVCKLRASMDDQSSRKWEAELDMIEFVIYTELSNSLNDSVATEIYTNADSDTLHCMLPEIIARVDMAYDDMLNGR